MESYIKKCRKALKRKKFISVSLVVLMLGTFIAGLVGIISTAVQDDYTYITLYAVITIAGPLVFLALTFVWMFTGSNVEEKINKELMNGEFSADEIMQIGKELNIYLFGAAAWVRCTKELGMDGVPEWVARDGVLPTKDDITSTAPEE